MTIHELLAATGISADDEIAIYVIDASGEPTKKITAAALANAIVELGSTVIDVAIGTMTGSGSTVTLTKTVAGMTANTRPFYINLSNPSAVSSDLTITPGTDTLTISATVNGSTDVTVSMGKVKTVTATSSI